MLAGVLSCCAADVPRGVASWPDGLGDHRAVVRVAEKSDAVLARIPWRLKLGLAVKGIIVTDAAGTRLRNMYWARTSPDSGEVVFQADQAGDYCIYYMPFSSNPVPWDYSVTYAPDSNRADPAWLQRHNLNDSVPHPEAWESLPLAEVIEIQARGEFDRFDPMEVTSTWNEMTALIPEHRGPYWVFPEDREHPIRMTRDLPRRWTQAGPKDEFQGETCRGEFYVFQLGIYPGGGKLENLDVAFTSLRSEDGKVIPSSALRCFNLGGTDWLGRTMKNAPNLDLNVIALWFGVQVPKETSPGRYAGWITLKPTNARESNIHLVLDVNDKVLDDAGDSDLWRLSRLRWLDSTIGLDDEVTAPYTPMKVHGRTVSCLGREVKLADIGLPASIKSGGREILARPMTFVVESDTGVVKFKGGKPKPSNAGPGGVTWEAESTGGDLTLLCRARMEFDGYTDFRVSVKSQGWINAKDIRLEIPIKREVATYMMGLGRKGGFRPEKWKWAWDIDRATTRSGSATSMPACSASSRARRTPGTSTTFVPPESPSRGATTARAAATSPRTETPWSCARTSGKRTLQLWRADRVPLRPADHARQAARPGALGPALLPRLRSAGDRSRLRREHHQHPPRQRTQPLHQLSVPDDGQALGLREGRPRQGSQGQDLLHRARAEHQPRRDVGAAKSGIRGVHRRPRRREFVAARAPRRPLRPGLAPRLSRRLGRRRHRHHGPLALAQLLPRRARLAASENVGIDGLYLDGIGYDREIMKRVRKVMDRARPGCLIDFHSGNEFPFNDLRISPANKYMEHFPYINSLWFGEGYDYNNESPDYWLVEVSGIPFGLYGEMLQDNGNPWRGMVYGMTARYYCGADPKHIWKLWDDFGIKDAKMIGYWSPKCPVTTDNKDVLATVYRKKGKTLISLASWAKEPARVRLAIDWKALGIDPTKARLTAPAIPGFQDAASFGPSDEIPVQPGRGWLLILDSPP